MAKTEQRRSEEGKASILCGRGPVSSGKELQRMAFYHRRYTIFNSVLLSHFETSVDNLNYFFISSLLPAKLERPNILLLSLSSNACMLIAIQYLSIMSIKLFLFSSGSF